MVVVFQNRFEEECYRVKPEIPADIAKPDAGVSGKFTAEWLSTSSIT